MDVLLAGGQHPAQPAELGQIADSRPDLGGLPAALPEAFQQVLSELALQQQLPEPLAEALPGADAELQAAGILPDDAVEAPSPELLAAVLGTSPETETASEAGAILLPRNAALANSEQEQQLLRIEGWLQQQQGDQAMRLGTHGQPPVAPEAFAPGYGQPVYQPGQSPGVALATPAPAAEPTPASAAPVSASPVPLAANASPELLSALLETAQPEQESGLQRAAGQPLLASAPAAIESNPATLRLQAPEARWGEQMLHALREQVELQVRQHSQQAHIRLDPPELGSLDIRVSHEQGKLSVQINAMQADVARLLNLISDRLRHELVGQSFTQVDVQVASDAGKGNQQQARQPDQPEQVMAARPLHGSSDSDRRSLADDVLISV